MIAHPQDMDYAYRGKALKDFSLMEYACIIEIVKQHSDKKQSESLHTGNADASSTAVDSALQCQNATHAILMMLCIHCLRHTHKWCAPNCSFHCCGGGNPSSMIWQTSGP